MLGIGMGEMLLIAAIALVVFGPEKFPDFAKIVLRTVRDLRGYVDEIQNEVSKELKPIKRELNKITTDSNKYMDTLSKEASISSTPAAKPVAASKSQADPTDRQDDSFDYGGPGYDHPDANPYGEYQDSPGGESAPPPETGNEGAPQQEEAAQEGTAGAGDGEKDDFDFSEPPVERMD